jgi:hypothetical protein
MGATCFCACRLSRGAGALRASSLTTGAPGRDRHPRTGRVLLHVFLLAGGRGGVPGRQGQSWNSNHTDAQLHITDYFGETIHYI